MRVRHRHRFDEKNTAQNGKAVVFDEQSQTRVNFERAIVSSWAAFDPRSSVVHCVSEPSS
jgi:hypothetical protein